MLKVNEIACVNACNKIKSHRLPYQWDLNIYRGCSHNCQYCFALYTHQYLDHGSFGKDIFVKMNIVSKLEEHLKRHSFEGEVINLGGVCDNYQPLEAKYKIMPEILKLLITYRVGCVISTKSDLILRDIELIKELSSITYVNVAASIISLDEELIRKLEPGTTSIERRLSMLERIKKETNASVGLHMMPIIPYVTDQKENLEKLYERSHLFVDYILPGTLNMRGETRKQFLNFMKHNKQGVYAKFISLYNDKNRYRNYQKNLYTFIHELEKKYQINAYYQRIIKEKLKNEKQLSFDFDEPM